ncbi:eCIS core domain-containing protein [Actinoplanes sp. NPDC049316]|uniref:eCIS core domain-containing protein n=1 Tax=Actinoplanes sp. NPDC049316 TaxID=3154727 RepID=UPI003424B98C
MSGPAAVPPAKAQLRRGKAEHRRDRRRRKRRPAELREIVASAGRPLEPSVRRELEERLGHDFSRVRIHADRDAATLTELAGADAVALGTDIFFADGAYRPETAAGRRLLVHELMHTIQLPDAAIATRAGREPGTVSRPTEPLELAAERVADSASEAAGAGPVPGPADAGPAAAAPAWMRYASVNPAQLRIEHLDPATLVDRVVAGVLRSLRGDPADAAGRIRLQFGRLTPELEAAVLDRLDVRLPSAEYRRVQDLAAEGAANAVNGSAVDTASTPAPVPSSTPTQAEAPEEDKAAEQDEAAEEDKAPEQDKAPAQENAPGQGKAPEEKAAEDGRTAEDGKRPEDSKAAEDAGAEGKDAEKKEAAEKTGTEGGKTEEEKGKDEGRRKEGAEEPPAAGSGAAAPGTAGAGPTPAAGGAGAATGAGAGGGAAAAAGGAGLVDLSQVDAVAEDPQGPLAHHGLRNRPAGTTADEIPEGERPIGVEPLTEEDVPNPDTTPEPPGPQTPEAEPPGPQAYLPKADLDVSAVPTADALELPSSGSPPAPAAPSFPAPPEPEIADDPGGGPGTVKGVAEAAERDRERERAESAEVGEAPGQVSPDALDREPDTTVDASSATAPGGAPDVGGPGIGGPDASGPAMEGPGVDGPGVDGPGVDGPGALDGPGAAGTVDGGPEAGGAVGGPDVAGDGGGPAAGVPGDALPADASLEAGGGSCGSTPEPAGEADSGAACGAPAPAAGKAEEEPAAEAPDLSGQEPDGALAAAGSLPATQMRDSLAGVDASVNRSVGRQRTDLAAAPPAMARPAGAPQTQHGTPQPGAPAASSLSTLAEVTPETLGKQKLPDGRPAPSGAPPTDRVSPPHFADTGQDTLSEAEVRGLQNAVDNVPTTDPALNQTVGAAPAVSLSGETDPALADEQRRRLGEQAGALRKIGRTDAATDLGEHRIYPDVRPETLRGAPPGAGPAPAGKAAGAAPPATAGPASGSSTPPQAVSAVVLQERGPQVQAGVAQGRTAIKTEQQTQRTGEAAARTENAAAVDKEIQANTAEQAGERTSLSELATARRAQWRTEQDGLLAENGKKADGEHTTQLKRISDKKAGTDGDIEARRQADDKDIGEQKRKAEADAQKEKNKKKDDDGWLGWAKSKIKSAFDALVSVVKGIFDLARKAINGIIEGFKKFATGLIEAARKAIVGFIKAVATALIAISGVLLAAFPELRDKVRKFIEDRRDAAINKVNQLADKLKQGVQKLLDALAAGLNKLLDLLEKGMLAAIELARAAVHKAIAFVENAIKMFGQFAALVADIAPDPLGWLGKLGTAAKAGIRDHLWTATKVAVKQWFNQKVESILGLGRMIFNVLVKGCFSMAKIARMAWQALIKALPMMIISIVIEKLVSMIIPAAGAIMTIVQGVIAAWGTISKIIAVFQKFFAFLKAVKAGGVAAACLFAQAVAAGVVALLDFITNFLLMRLVSAAKGVASKLKGLAQKIMAALKRGASAARKGAGKAINAAKRGAKAAAGALKRGAQKVGSWGRKGLAKAKAGAKRALGAVRNGAKRLGARFAKTRVGRALAAAGKKVKEGYRKAKAKYQAWREKRRNKPRKEPPGKQARLDAAIARMRPKVHRILGRGVSRRILRVVLAGLRLWYRLTAVSLDGGRDGRVRATLNPTGDVDPARVIADAELLAHVDRRIRQVVARRQRLRRQQLQATGAQPAAPAASPGTTLNVPQQSETLGTFAELQRRRAASANVRELRFRGAQFHIGIGESRHPTTIGRFDLYLRGSTRAEQGVGRYAQIAYQARQRMGGAAFQDYLRLFGAGAFGRLPAGGEALRHAGVAALFSTVRTLGEGSNVPSAFLTGSSDIAELLTAQPAEVPDILEDVARNRAMSQEGSLEATRRIYRSGIAAPGITPQERAARLQRSRSELTTRRTVAGVQQETPVALMRKLAEAIVKVAAADGLVLQPGTDEQVIRQITTRIDKIFVDRGWLDPEDIEQ